MNNPSAYLLESAGKNVNSVGVEDHDFSKDDAGSCIILKADSLDEAAKIASSAPIIKNGGEICVQPCGEMKLWALVADAALASAGLL